MIQAELIVTERSWLVATVRPSLSEIKTATTVKRLLNKKGRPKRLLAYSPRDLRIYQAPRSGCGSTSKQLQQTESDPSSQCCLLFFAPRWNVSGGSRRRTQQHLPATNALGRRTISTRNVYHRPPLADTVTTSKH